MKEMLYNSSFFCISLTLAAFCTGSICQKKWKLAILNPILTGAGIVMVTLWILDIPIEQYQEHCLPLSFLMTPATICLGISFARQLQKLKGHLPAIMAGVAAGTVCSLFSVSALARVFGLEETLLYSLLPKSVTTAIGVAISQETGGSSSLTATAIILTGILGNTFGPFLTRLFHIEEPIAQGTAYGTASHVIGTARAAELSQLAGAAGSLSLSLAGLLTALIFSFK